MSVTIKAFVTDLLDRYLGDLDPTATKFINGDFLAGEYETAAIMMIEDGPVSRADVDEFERLIPQLDEIDRPIAQRVIAKRRKQLVA